MGLNQYSPEVYKILYNDSIRINPNTIKMPKFDDTIRVYCNNQPAQELIFKGFRYKYNDEPSFIKDKNVIASYYLCYSSPNNDKPSKVPLSNLSMVINQDGDSLDGSIIRKSMLAGQLPVIDYAEMKLDLASMTIQIPKIDSIRTQNHANTAVQLFLIGLATDVILFDLWIHEMGRKLQ